MFNIIDRYNNNIIQTMDNPKDAYTTAYTLGMRYRVEQDIHTYVILYNMYQKSTVIAHNEDEAIKNAIDNISKFYHNINIITCYQMPDKQYNCFGEEIKNEILFY